MNNWFNENLKKLRLKRGISQVEFAQNLGVTKQCVSNWENENIQPSIEMLAKIADALNVTTDYLLSREEKRYLDVTGISETAIQNLQAIIQEIKGKDS